MSTKKLAKELGLLRQRSQSSNGTKKSLVSNQTFSYLIVIDFESTCWKDKNNHGQEIIEFPAVLLNTSTGEIESEFHTYVQPQEHPILSEFCTELTGIKQMQVEAGIPLQICLSRFSRWLQNLQLEKGVVFPNRKQKVTASSPSQKLCTFVTWSDWDLGVCLQYECKRKQLYQPDVLNSWIDLRSTYRLFYDRKPKGLNGALQDLGIQFSGREHSGLDDSRNTAMLAARMMRDGCVMKITRSLVKNPPLVKPAIGNTTADNKKVSNTNREENIVPSSSKIPLNCQRITCSENIFKTLNSKENSNSVCQSLISPKTLLNGKSMTQWGHSRRSDTAEGVANTSSSVLMTSVSPHNNNNNNNNSNSSSNSSSGLVLCSITVGCISNLPQTNQFAQMATTVGQIEDEVDELFVETEDRCGSYDDVVLEGDDDFISGVEGEFEADVSHFDRVNHDSNDHGDHINIDDNITRAVNSEIRIRTQNITKEPLVSSFIKGPRSEVNVSHQLSEIRQHSTISEPDACFAVPKSVPRGFKRNQHKPGLKSSLHIQEASNELNKNSKMSTPFLFRNRPFLPEKTSTPNISFARPKPVTTHITKHKETPKSSFTIYIDQEKPGSSMCDSFCAPKSALSSLSNNTLLSRTSRSISVTMKPGQKITSPLCACGRRAKRQVVSNGGPNHGRGFFCCPVRRSGSGGRIQKGCEFFNWESAVMKSSPVASPDVRSSVTLCQMNSTLSCRPVQRSAVIRKSY